MAWTTNIKELYLPINSGKDGEPSTPVAPAIRFIRLPEVMQLTFLRPSAVLALDGFPKHVQVGGSRSKAWIELEILQ